ncbi:hypothetical protein Q7I18_18750 [Aeromonas veronii]|uniref:hypothetical protein n=1 Tax=Aeromonas TaxID=642 RepID=UPI00258CCE0C|nr:MULTISPECIES: hypothetical protein [Aeromonas]MDM5116057.1 hypothetical protein [Aeromonas salmonicida]
MTYQRLTEQEIEDLRKEMTLAGYWAKKELEHQPLCKSSYLQKWGISAERESWQNKA